MQLRDRRRVAARRIVRANRIRRSTRRDASSPAFQLVATDEMQTIQANALDRWRRKEATGMGLFSRLALLVALIATGVASPLGACDTPVYRYAMYSWPASLYHVFYFHSGEIREDDRQAIDRVREAASDPERPANVMLHIVDTTRPEGEVDLPEAVRRWRDERDVDESLGFVVFTPKERLLSEAAMSGEEVTALITSPTRRRLAELLDAGRTGVLLVLTSSDEAASDAAEQVVDQVITRASEGTIQPATLPGAAATDLGEDALPLDVGKLVVDRRNPQERWLVRQLLGVESDLTEYAEPMVFPVYGRGRAMEPFIGGGITVENLSDAVAFVCGACSCEIKELNPGMDLLMAWNWEDTATRIAQRVGDEEGNETYLSAADLLPAVVGGSDLTVATEADDDEILADAPLIASADADPLSQSADPIVEQEAVKFAEAGEQVDGAMLDEETIEERLLKRLAVVFGLGFVALVSITFLLFRMRAGS